jgi:hypothetical protein
MAMPSVSIRNAMTHAADLDLPSMQCKKTTPPSRRASRMHADVSAKCCRMFCDGVSVRANDVYAKSCGKNDGHCSAAQLMMCVTPARRSPSASRAAFTLPSQIPW